LSNSATLGAGFLAVAQSGTGDFLQEGSSQATFDNVTIGSAGGTGTYTIHGGTLSARTISVSSGDSTTDSHGTMTADGGAITPDYLGIGEYGHGTMSLSGSAHLTVNGDEIVSQFGEGVFTQGATDHVVTGSLTVGNAGHFTLNTGGTLTVGGTTGTLGVLGGGVFDQPGGDVNAANLVDWGTYNLGGGTVRGSVQSIDSGGVLNWTGGQIGDATHGTTTVGGSGTLVISGSGYRPLVNREFTNQGGLVQWTGTTDILAQQGTTVVNSSGGVVEITNNQTFTSSTGFTNSATLWKHGATGLTTFNSDVTSDGTITVDSGTASAVAISRRLHPKPNRITTATRQLSGRPSTAAWNGCANGPGTWSP
jgi:hypothetical protein